MKKNNERFTTAINILLMAILSLSACGMAKAEDKKDAEKTEKADAAAEIKSDFTKIYLMTSAKSTRNGADKVFEGIKNGGKIKDGIFEYVPIEKKTDAKDMTCGLMAIVSVDRVRSMKSRVKSDKKGSCFYPMQIVYLSYQLFMAEEGKWKKTAKGDLRFCMMEEPPEDYKSLTQLNAGILSNLIEIKCKAKKNGKDSVEISGKITNLLPIDLGEITISAPLSTELPSPLAHIVAVKSLKAGETVDFKANAPKITDFLCVYEEFGNVTATSIYKWNEAFALSAGLPGEKKKNDKDKKGK